MLRAMRSFLKENDMMAYLAMMAVRLIELHRVLKPTGSLYLHCDPTASHYLKLLLDAIFGAKHFRNEIIWHYNTGGKGRSAFLKKHDVIFWYSKSDDRTFNWKDVAIQRKVGTAHLRHGTDKDGREFYEDYSPRKSGKQYRWYLDEGLVPMDVWTDIQAINPAARERLGYPTQKPVALLERIIAASSNEGDLVLDPFCGCGTTVHAAQKLKRRWIGIDVTHLAIGLIKRRLSDAFKGVKFDIVGVPQDVGGATTLAAADKYEFQKWALSMIDSIPYKGGKKGGDGGVDGYVYFKPDGKTTEKAIVSVKGGLTLTPSMVKDLVVTVDNEKAKMGIFLTLTPPTKGMVAEAAKAGFYKTDYGQFPKIQIVTVEQLFAPSNPIQMPWQDTSAFKKAKKENTEKQDKLDL